MNFAWFVTKRALKNFVLIVTLPVWVPLFLVAYLVLRLLIQLDETFSSLRREHESEIGHELFNELCRGKWYE